MFYNRFTAVALAGFAGAFPALAVLVIIALKTMRSGSSAAKKARPGKGSAQKRKGRFYSGL